MSCHLKDFQGTTNPNHVTGGFSQYLRDLPYHCRLDGGGLRSQLRQLPADGRAYCPAARLHRLPRQQQLQPDHQHLRVVPPQGFPGNHQSQPRCRWIRADLRYVPQHCDLAARNLRSLQVGIPADRFAYGAAAPVHRLSRQQQLQHHGYIRASVATRPTTTTRLLRCPIRDSRRPASSATTPCSGPTPSSITPLPALS